VNGRRKQGFGGGRNAQYRVGNRPCDGGRLPQAGRLFVLQFVLFVQLLFVLLLFRLFEFVLYERLLLVLRLVRSAIGLSQLRLQLLSRVLQRLPLVRFMLQRLLQRMLMLQFVVVHRKLLLLPWCDLQLLLRDADFDAGANGAADDNNLCADPDYDAVHGEFRARAGGRNDRLRSAGRRLLQQLRIQKSEP